MPILYDPSRDEHYIPLPSFPLVRITPARPDDAQRLVEIYNVPSIGKRLYAIPWPFHPVDALASIAKDSASYAACRPLLDSHTSSPAAAPFDVLPSCPFVAIRILYPEGSEGWGESLLIGTIGLHPDDEPSPNGAEAVRTWEVGYVLDPEFRGKGWMGEAVGELFKTMEGWLKGTMDRWGAWVEKDNPGSIRLLTKLGFDIVHEEMSPWPEHKGGGSRASYKLERGKFFPPAAEVAA